jgi:methyltransferase (TIGR00027 family)
LSGAPDTGGSKSRRIPHTNEGNMEQGQPSRTAQGAALHRAAHQLVDRPPVFADPLAIQIVGAEAAGELRDGYHVTAENAGLRAFIATRSRFTEDCLHEAAKRGVRQYVLLGAGLDTFAYRETRKGLRVFEVDHPATQAWKRSRLDEVEIAIPGWVTYTPVDFERETIGDGLTRAGFAFAEPAVFAWLGVTPYLTREAVMNTLRFVASMPEGSEIVFDYAQQADGLNEKQNQHFKAMAERVAALGEPFRSAFDPNALLDEIKTLGFSFVEDLDSDALNARYFQSREDGLYLRGRGHLMHARV